MPDKKLDENLEQTPAFDVDELDDSALEEASGGSEFNAYCPDNNSGNCVAGCT